MKNSTRRFLSLLFSILLIFGAGIVYMVLIQPVYDEIGVKRGTLMEKEASLKSRLDLAAQMKKLLDQYGGSQQAFEQMSAALPENPDAATLLAQIQGVAVSSDVTLSGIQYSQQASSQPSGVPSKNSKVQPLGIISFQVTATGTYDGVSKFITSIEESVRLMDIKTLNISPANESFLNGDTKIDMRIVSYYQKSTEASVKNK
jgi:Tfp pilus assembly protein PilO